MHTQPPDGELSLRSGNRWARFVQRYFLWLLLGCYALATVWPGPGLAMKSWEWSPGTLANQPLTLSILLLAVMLFVAAMLTDVQRIRSVLQNPLLLCLAMVAVLLILRVRARLWRGDAVRTALPSSH